MLQPFLQEKWRNCAKSHTKEIVTDVSFIPACQFSVPFYLKLAHFVVASMIPFGNHIFRPRREAGSCDRMRFGMVYACVCSELASA